MDMVQNLFTRGMSIDPSGIMKHRLAFMSKKCPEEDMIKEMRAALQDEEGNSDDISGNCGYKYNDSIHEDSDANVTLQKMISSSSNLSRKILDELMPYIFTT